MSDCKWEVGKTYRTTLPGVTATITHIEGDDVIGDVSNRMCRAWRWCKVDGKFRMFENSQEHPHLTTELADEPQVEPVKPQASSPYDRVIGSVEVDLWTLADIYGITSHRLFSAWKKITMAGRRGPKDKLRDLREARVALDKEIAKLEAEGGAE